MTRIGRRAAVPWPPQDRTADPFEDVDNGGFFVFVPAIMGVGTTSGAFAGVRTGRPSSFTVNPPSHSSVRACFQNRLGCQSLMSQDPIN